MCAQSVMNSMKNPVGVRLAALAKRVWVQERAIARADVVPARQRMGWAILMTAVKIRMCGTIAPRAAAVDLPRALAINRPHPLVRDALVRLQMMECLPAIVGPSPEAIPPRRNTLTTVL